MEVLIIGVHDQIMQGVLGEVGAAGFDAHGVLAANGPVATLAEGRWDVVAIGGGVANDLRQQIHDTAARMDSAPEVIDVYGPNTLVTRLREIAR